MKQITLIFVFVLISIYCLAQRPIDNDTPKTMKERGYYGGGLGLGGGTGYFSLALNPIIGYMVKPNFSVGTGVNYSFTTYTDIKPSRTLDQYGISPFIRYNFDQIFLYSEYNYLSTNFLNLTERKFVDRLLLGIGYFQPIGQRSAINIVGCYDVLYRQLESPFPSPYVIRGFITIY